MKQGGEQQMIMWATCMDLQSNMQRCVRKLSYYIYNIILYQMINCLMLCSASWLWLWLWDAAPCTPNKLSVAAQEYAILMLQKRDTGKRLIRTGHVKAELSWGRDQRGRSTLDYANDHSRKRIENGSMWIKKNGLLVFRPSVKQKSPHHRYYC